MIRLEILPAAKIHLKIIAREYAKERKGLGREFVGEVRELLAIVRRFPESMPRLRTRISHLAVIRVAKLPRFPYLLFYRLQADALQVLAIFHSRRDYLNLLEVP